MNRKRVTAIKLREKERGNKDWLGREIRERETKVDAFNDCISPKSFLLVLLLPKSKN